VRACEAGPSRLTRGATNCRLLLALRELSGGAMLTQIGVGASTVRVVACARFLVALIPHTGAGGACDVEALHFAHMLQLLYPVELGARTRRAHEAEEAAHGDALDEEYSAQREMGSEIEEHLDQDAESDALFTSFQATYLDPALSRPPASSRWLSPLTACPGVVHACIVAHMLPRDGDGGGAGGGGGGDLLILSSAGQVSPCTAARQPCAHARAACARMRTVPQTHACKTRVVTRVGVSLTPGQDAHPASPGDVSTSLRHLVT